MPRLDPKRRKSFKLLRAIRNYVWWYTVKYPSPPLYFVKRFIEAGKYDPANPWVLLYLLKSNIF